jgi:hypothetical protein
MSFCSYIEKLKDDVHDPEVIGEHLYNITLEYEYEDKVYHGQNNIMIEDEAIRNNSREKELYLIKNYQSPLLLELQFLNNSHGVHSENEENLYTLRNEELLTRSDILNSSPFPHDLLINIEEKINNFTSNRSDLDGLSTRAADVEDSTTQRYLLNYFKYYKNNFGL